MPTPWRRLQPREAAAMRLPKMHARRCWGRGGPLQKSLAEEAERERRAVGRQTRAMRTRV